MLSAFTARPIVELKQRDKSRIESILAYGDRVLVGLHTGSLRIYRVNELPADPPVSSQQTNGSQTDGQVDDVESAADAQPLPKVRPVDLLREEEKFSRRPIQQLAVIKEANTLVALTDNYVNLHDLATYGLTERLERTRGASTFAATSNIVKDPATGIPSIVSRLAVAVKRKVLLWAWRDMELAMDDEEGAERGNGVGGKEIVLQASVKSLAWATGTKIVAGMDSGFVLVDVESREVTEVLKPGSALGEAASRFGAVSSSGMGYMGMGSWVPKPMATKLAEGQVLLAKDVNTLFIEAETGKALDKRQIPWTTAPEAIGYSYPYLLALQPAAKGVLEVRNPDTLALLQSIPLQNAAYLHVPQPNISLAHAGKGFLVASERHIWRMGALDYDTQISELISGGRYDEAISLLEMLEDTLLKDKGGRLREVKMLKAQSLFDIRKYRDALDLFTEARAPPARVISLYPKAIAGDLSSVEPPENGVANEADQDETNDGDPATSPMKTAMNSPSAPLNRSLLRKLKAEAKPPESDTSSIRSGKAGEASDTGSIRGKHSETVPTDKPLEGRDLKIAVNELCAFLAQARVQLQKHISYDGKLKQTQSLPTDSQAEASSKPPFHLFIAEDHTQEHAKNEHIDWEQKLREVATLVDTTLFRAYMLARPGLAGSLFRLDNFCDPAVVREKLYENARYADLIDFLHGKKLHREALELLAKFGQKKTRREEEEDKKKDEEKPKEETDVPPALRGPHRTVAYLQQLPPDLIDLILEFAEWPLRADPDLGMEIFVADTENAETLPRHAVLDFLHQIDEGLAIRYLEHVIHELNDLTPEFHQKLVEAYLERLKGGRENGLEEEEIKRCKEKLEAFLRSSAQYNRARVFRLLPTDEPDFFESRAIVLSNMGQHKQALQIYVFQLKDYAKAEEYCNQTYLINTHTSQPPPSSAAVAMTHATSTPLNRHTYPSTFDSSISPSSPEHPTSIYHVLLSLYLSPPPPHEPNWPAALALLSRHGARLPASATLDLVPDDVAVRDLEPYFAGRMRAAAAVRNRERVAARLHGVRKAAVDAELALGPAESGFADVHHGGMGISGGAAAGGPGAGKNRRVVVTEDRHCAVCHKRFGGSAIRVYPDNSVVHYGCIGRPRGTSGGDGGGWGKEGVGLRKGRGWDG
ncbi:AvaB protein [Lineolata rhizophorae]|uniref:AvaB protein n=1 Tax=Lineolata rhizophorae TaxID=578093 RepID=A0A6A6P8K9_9PEZI|nr:AvaB protein [Lineolata rhizophorae]